jgi:hypothetical protein
MHAEYPVTFTGQQDTKNAIQILKITTISVLKKKVFMLQRNEQ